MTQAADDKGLIHEIGPNSNGRSVSKGVYAIGPQGQLGVVPLPIKTKQGWRAATQADIDASAARAAAIAAKKKGAPIASSSSPAPEQHAEQQHTENTSGGH
ncbi:MAG TPA: hypothetical protein VGG74_11745 [Kofleriaceae bacterium]|jgi:hypothetical protein